MPRDHIADALVDEARALANHGRLEPALATYQKARDRWAAAGDDSESAWCDTLIATVHTMRGAIDTAEALFERAAPILEGTDRSRYALCLSSLGGLQFGRSRFADGARNLDLALAITESGTDRLALADCLTYRAVTYLNAGNPAGVDGWLRTAEQIYLELNQTANLSRCRQAQAMARMRSGRYQDAEKAMLEARATLAAEGNVGDVAVIDNQLGVLYQTVDRVDDAVAAFERALGALRPGETNDLAGALHGNLGGLHARRGRLTEALAEFAAAEAIFTRLGDHARSMVCRGNRGSALMRVGRIREALPLLESAYGYLRQHPELEPDATLFKRNIAHINGMLGNEGATLHHLAEARKAAERAGNTLEMARCDLLAGVALGPRSDDDITPVLDLAGPAILFFYRQRQQFSAAPDRAAWSAGQGKVLEFLFEWLVRIADPGLMAELIEVCLNSGAFTTPDPDTSETATALATRIAAVAGNDHPTVPGLTPAANGALIAGAELPVQPPPLIRFPGGGIALGGLLESAVHRYGLVERAIEVDAW
ncbi:tetratricopeptide repeat protein [Nocardia sp. NPDC057227]|uniref:tetratricopeptide repeat protein n=1 Tax=Nocardia sp. NPDC057227 TaxID=3346056 RepID=UPI00362E4C59